MLETPKENWSNKDDLHSDALTASHGNEEARLQRESFTHPQDHHKKHHGIQLEHDKGCLQDYPTLPPWEPAEMSSESP
nr:hypothetical protein I308_05465 [Cryptococcus tetragattii IND107]